MDLLLYTILKYIIIYIVIYIYIIIILLYIFLATIEIGLVNTFTLSHPSFIILKQYKEYEF